MTRDDIIRLAIKCQLVTTSNRDGIYADALQRFAALVAAEKDKEIKRLQDMLYEQLGELTALRADKQMRVHIEQLKEQPR